MKTIHLLLPLLIVSGTIDIHARKNSDRFDINWISDPGVTGVKKEQGHATYIPYSSTEAMLADRNHFDSPWVAPENAMYLDLNGIWKFRWVAGTPEGPAPSEWMDTQLDESDWDNIRVPMSWEMTGRYNQPAYVNCGYPFHNEPPYARHGYEEHDVTDHNATGFYRRSFDLPDDWNTKRVFLHFNGVYSGVAVWVNGEFCGYSQGANNDAEFDITKALHPGQNQLSARVYRWTDGSYIEAQDMWRMSGIHRDVYLVATPTTFIRDHYIVTENQSRDATSGRLNVTLDIDNRDREKGTKTYRLTLTDADGNVKATSQQSLRLNGKPQKVTLSTDILDGLTPWNAENPYLYNVTIAQIADGKEEMVFNTKYGFRNISYINHPGQRYVTINGKRIFFKGTNIHDTHPVFGRYVDVPTMIRDITLMKQANINTMRTSHYPRDPKMYSICDAYGMYVMDEADLECHGNQTLTDNPAWRHAFVDRNERMVLRDRNRPSVIFWSLGNENAKGDNMPACAKTVRALDPRPIHCHGNTGDSLSTDMYSTMYSTLAGVAQLKEGHNNLPFFMCEYAHAMGQAVGNLADYWKEIESSTGTIGGCIWDWVDQAVYDPKTINAHTTISPRGFHAWTGGYDFDRSQQINPGHRNAFQGNFLNNGIITPDRRWTAKLTEVKKVYQYVDFLEFDKSTGRLTLQNKYPFTNLADRFNLSYRLLKDGIAIESGTLALPSVPPLSTTTVDIPLSDNMADTDSEYSIIMSLNLINGTPWADAGYALADEQFILTPRSDTMPPVPVTGTLTIDGNHVYDNDFSIVFDKNGVLKNYIYKGYELLAASPEYNDFRRIDNDSAGSQANGDDENGCNAHGDGQYDYASTGIESHSITDPLHMTDNHAEMTMQAKGSKTDYTIHYVIYPGGILDMRVDFTPKRRGLRRLGLGWQFAPGFENVEYYARGPQSNYVDRKTGSYLGRYNTSVDGMIDENIHPQTYGDRLDLRDMTLFNEINGIRLNILTKGRVGFSLSHYDELDWNHNLHFNRLHWNDMKRHDRLFAHFDYWQRGIGNNSCGADKCLPAYETPYPGNYQGADSLSYTLRFTPRF